MNVLVTGGAGYIGSHTAKALASSGHTPVVYDNLSRGHEWAVKWGPLVRADLSDAATLRGTIDKYRIEAVMHFAAYAYVGESMKEPGLYFQNNAVNSLRLLDAVKRAGVRTVVFSSTCATYGMPARLPIDESHPQVPMNPYGESKLFVEKALRWYGEIHGLRWVALRYFNAAGADPEGEIGECHTPETHLVPLAIHAVEDPGRPVSIFGTDYPTADGTAVRDYIHVMDLAGAHVRALHYLDAGGTSCALNLGTGRGYTVRQVMDAIESVAGRRPSTRNAGRRAGDPPELVADGARARKVLGWTPGFSQLESIIETAWAWHARERSGIRSSLARSTPAWGWPGLPAA